MTFFFGGEVICELPEAELLAWHESLKQCFAESNFLLKGEGIQTTSAVADVDLSFQILELSIFPPRRNNLVVAILEASPAWHALYGDIRLLSHDIDSIGLSETSKSGKAKWTAHITLANLIGGSKSETKQLGDILKTFSEGRLQPEHCVYNAKSISMGGLVPRQAELDWNFEFRTTDQNISRV